MKKLLTLVLCWLLAFSAMAETTLKAKTAASVAGGYVTSLNKVDGSFEDVVTQWVTSVGTIVPTDSTIMQGEKIGVWSGTGTGTLDLQWTATSSNTYEASAQVDVQGEDDVYICAYVGTTETGCKLIPALSKIQKVSVVADSVMVSAFYLRLKHTGSDAFNVKVDDGKIEPWTPQAVNLSHIETITYSGISGWDGSNRQLFKTLDPSSNYGKLLQHSNTGFTKFNVLEKCSASIMVTGALLNVGVTYLEHYDKNNTQKKSIYLYPYDGRLNSSLVVPSEAGDYFFIRQNSYSLTDSLNTVFSIQCSKTSENVVQSYAPSDFLGEIKLLPSTTAPKGFIPADGKSIGKTSGNYQGDAYYALYALRWAMASTTAGEPYVISSTKGASAQADWDAGKTITIDVRGLFFRAAGGNAGAVGSKQGDAFQGHYHQLSNGGGGGAIGSYVVTNNVSQGNSSNAYSPITDGANGTPRIASETRPINTSEYAYMRYGTSAPTLLALPNGTETNYSITAIGNAAQVITANVTDIPFIATTQNNLVWSGSSFTSPTDSIYQVSASINFSANTGNAFEYYINGSRVGRLYSQATGVSSIFPFSTTIAVPANSTFSIRSTVNATLSNTADHRLQITRVNGKIDKTFVGNVAKNQVAIVYESQPSGTDAGASGASSWSTRVLNTIDGDVAIASLSSNQITLAAGEYDIDGESPFYASSRCKIRLRNLTDSLTAIVGSSVYNSDTYLGAATSTLKGRLSLSAAKTFSLQYYCTIAKATNGLGAATSSGENEIYSKIKITKLNGQ